VLFLLTNTGLWVDMHNGQRNRKIVIMTVAVMRFTQPATARITRVRVMETATESHMDQQQEGCQLWERGPHGSFLKRITVQLIVGVGP
jgi:hypothetical protein